MFACLVMCKYCTCKATSNSSKNIKNLKHKNVFTWAIRLNPKIRCYSIKLEFTYGSTLQAIIWTKAEEANNLKVIIILK